MALEDIVFVEGDTYNLLEIPTGSLGNVTDIVEDNDEILELILTGGGGETSYVF